MTVYLGEVKTRITYDYATDARIMFSVGTHGTSHGHHLLRWGAY